jgi:hypothetical protein
MESDAALDLARAHVYRFLAAALADPRSRRFDGAPDRRLQSVALAAGELLAAEAPFDILLAPTLGAFLAAERVVLRVRPVHPLREFMLL